MLGSRGGAGLGEGPEGQVARGLETELDEGRMKGGAGRDAREERVVGEENGTCPRKRWFRTPKTDGEVGVAVGGAALWAWLGR